jgi:hypothetical protein
LAERRREFEPSEVAVISSEDGKSEQQTGDVSGDTSSPPESSSPYNGGEEDESDDGSEASGSDEGDGSEESEDLAPCRHARSTRATTAAASTKPPAALRVTRGESSAVTAQQQQPKFTAKRTRVYQGSSNSSGVDDSQSEDEVEVSEDSRPVAQPRRAAPAACPKPQTKAAPQPARAHRAAAATAQQRMRSTVESPDASNDTGSDDQGSSESESEGGPRRKGWRNTPGNA